MRRLRTALLPILPAALALMSGSAQAATLSCEELASQPLSHAKIDLAQTIAPGALTLPGERLSSFPKLPAFCRIAATLKLSPDSDIKVEIWLPAAWNGKFEAVGNGGWAGKISYGAMATALQSGYATASTDTGHSVENGSFVPGHPEKLLDFMYRSEHEMTVQAKAVLSAFYGGDAKKSYWNGCSTGGRQGLMEAARFPGDFDGIVAGDPVNPRAVHDAWDLSVTSAIHRNPESIIPNEKFPLIHKAVIDACDMLDGVKDGLVENPKLCRFDPVVLTCKTGDTASCLTNAQIDSVNRILSPGKSNGVEFYPGLALTSELGWKGKAGPDANPPGADNFRYVVLQNTAWDWHSFDAQKDVAAAKIADRQESVDSADLSSFTAHGGKLILYHGWSDPLVSPQATINYFGRLQQQTQGAGGATRLFLVPGMGHCQGGEGATDNFDAVAALDNWVERGDAPQRISAAHIADGVAVRTRPLCAYPLTAHFDGRGSSDDAANFICKAD